MTLDGGHRRRHGPARESSRASIDFLTGLGATLRAERRRDRGRRAVGVIGVGRIGRLHASLLRGPRLWSAGAPGSGSGSRTTFSAGAAERLADELGVRVAASVEGVSLHDPAVDVVAIPARTPARTPSSWRPPRKRARPSSARSRSSLDIEALDRALAAVDEGRRAVPGSASTGASTPFAPVASARPFERATRSASPTSVRIVSRDPGTAAARVRAVLRRHLLARP